MMRYFPVTISLIALSVIVSLMSNLGQSSGIIEPLLIASRGAGLSQIASGEIWRLITPIVIHFGILHLLFNMLWLWDLGKLIEGKRGPQYFALFIVVVGIASNLVQYFLGGSPNFGGMSGVVYGLLGYIWMQGKYNPRFGYVLHQSIVAMMLVWFVLCWTGLVGPIANWAHTAGLVIGVAWGYLERGPKKTFY